MEHWVWFVERERSESVNGVQVWHGSDKGTSIVIDQEC